MVRTVFISFLTLISLSTTPVAAEPLRVLTENWPPMAYEENGKKTGMAVELTQMIQKKIAETTGQISPIEIMPFARGYHTTLTRPNTVLFAVARTPERETHFRFLGPITNGEIQLFAKPHSLLALHKGPVDKNTVIATVRGSVHETYLVEQGYKNIVLVSDPVTNIKLLMAGRVDLVCDDTLAIDELTRRAGFPNVNLPTIHTIAVTSHYYAFSKGTRAETLVIWKKALEEIKRNGEFKTLYSKWFKNLSPSPDVVLTNYETQKTSLKKDTRPLGIAKVK